MSILCAIWRLKSGLKSCSYSAKYWCLIKWPPRTDHILRCRIHWQFWMKFNFTSDCFVGFQFWTDHHLFKGSFNNNQVANLYLINNVSQHSWCIFVFLRHNELICPCGGWTWLVFSMSGYCLWLLWLLCPPYRMMDPTQPTIMPQNFWNILP